jgi:PAS domain S-box-containing protein
MASAIEHANADRALLLIRHCDGYSIEAEAWLNWSQIAVELQQRPLTDCDLPQSVLRHVIETGRIANFDDPSAAKLLGKDSYILHRRPTSLLCLPLMYGTELLGILYLEKSFGPRTFTSQHVAMMELLASATAIDLKNSELSADIGYIDSILVHERGNRARAEDALNAVEMRWRNVCDCASIGIAFLYPDTYYMAANATFQNMLGYTEEELTKLTPLKVTHEDHRLAAELVLKRIVEDPGRPQEIEKRYRRKDGSTFWARVRDSYLPGGEDAPSLLLAAAIDISSRKQIEEERNTLLNLIHDSIMQMFGAISLQLIAAEQIISTGRDNGLIYIKRARDLAGLGQAEARASILGPK